MKNRKFMILSLVYIVLVYFSILMAQDPPPPGIPPPQQEEVDHTAANEKLAREIQKAIDALHELKDATKIEMLKKIKKHIEDNKKTEPQKNLDEAIKKAVKKGTDTPQGLENLVKGWKKSLGLATENPDQGWKATGTGLRVNRILLEPIIYAAGPNTGSHDHAFFTVEFKPGEQPEYLNARFSDVNGSTFIWLVQNLPLLPYDTTQVISYVINVAAFGSGYDFLKCDFSVSTAWETNPQFSTMGTVDLVPQPTLYNVQSGSDDPTLAIGSLSVSPRPPGLPKAFEFRYRGCKVPNADLDNSKNYPDNNPVPNDINACGPAAAANSLEWLKKQHPELAGETSSLRSKLDSLKKYMNLSKKDTNGVRFDSMVVGKLTLIDKLKLPISVKYQTKHKSGNVEKPLASTEKPNHTADNQGKQDVPPNFDWVQKEINDGEDVEIHVGWYGPVQDDGKRQRIGGHWVVVTGYFTNGMTKGIYIKDDTDQQNKGGLRHSYFEWAPGDTPYLVGMTDANGNVAIIESAVSESYDPAVTFDDDPVLEQTDPWEKISLTTADAKILPSVVVPVKTASAFVPIFTGVVSTGALIYIITQESDDPVDCSFTANALSSAPLCNLPNGAIQVSINPVDQYEFAWSNGSTTQNIEGLGAGDYSVTVTRTGTTCTQVVTVSLINENPEVDATIQTEPADCGIPNGTASVIPTSPGNYSFIWSTGSTEQNQSGLAAGNYSVTVTTIGTCSGTFPVVIEQLPFEPTITFTTTPSSCGLSDGTIQVTVDPSAAYDYNWSGGQSGDQIVNVSPGTYSVTVSIPGTSCSKTGEATVDELPPSFTLTASTTPSSCGLSDGTATVIADPPGLYTIAWSNGQTTEQATGLIPGNYSVTVTLQGTTCSQNSSVTVDELPASFTLTTTTTPAACGVADGTATVVVDPPGTYSYAWSSGHTTEQATALAAGTYSVTVSIPGTNCTQSISVTIDQLPPAFTLSFSSTPANCGQSDGTATIVPEPSGEYTYSWPGGHTTPTVSGLMSGFHQVTVTIPGTTCSQTLNVEVGQVPLQISTTTSSTPAGCGIANGTATVDTVITPPGFLISFLWSDGQMGPMAIGLIPGTYIVTISLEAPGCFLMHTDTVLVEQVQPGFTGTITPTAADCGIANGSASIIVTPDGSYTFLWSDGQTGPVLQNVVAGNYSVVVTDANSCTASFSTDIPQLPAEHITITNTTPGNCTGGGDIAFTLVTNGTGPLVAEVISPEGTTTFTLAPGNYLLSSFLNVFPGLYTINVHDQGAGPSCVESIMTTVQDLTPALMTEDDVYFTQSEVPVNGNVLDNDSGLSLAVTGISNILGGTVSFSETGDFTFTPNPGFSGDGSFTYSVLDDCGNESTAVVTINVQMVVCDFTITPTLIPANCGISNGYINIEVNEPGSYTYFWNTGDTGSELEDIASGEYTVTIADVNLGCELEFIFELTEFPAEYVDDIGIVQPTCTVAGEVLFTLSVPGPQDELTLSITNPDGTVDVFLVNPGVTQLSDYVNITEGLYTIEVFIGNAGPDCIETFSAMINPALSLTIFEEAVFPPSTPISMDGRAIVIVQPPIGQPPYQVLLNGTPYTTSTDPIIQIMGLGVGTYTVQVIDAAGCESNIITITIPFPDEPVSFGTILINLPYDQSNVEHNHTSSTTLISTGLYADLRYRIGNAPQRIRGIFVPFSRGKNAIPHYAEMNHLTNLTSLTQKKFRFELEGGLGIRSFVPSSIGYDPIFATLHASSKMEFGKILHVQAEMSIRGWRVLETPQWGVTLMLPFLE